MHNALKREDNRFVEIYIFFNLQQGYKLTQFLISYFGIQPDYQNVTYITFSTSSGKHVERQIYSTKLFQVSFPRIGKADLISSDTMISLRTIDSRKSYLKNTSENKNSILFSLIFKN